MNLGALVDLGVDFTYLKNELLKLGLGEEYEIIYKKILKKGIMSAKVDINIIKHQHKRSFKDIKFIINSSHLTKFCKKKALEIFNIIAKAEGKIHNKDIENVHFHEIGGIDSIIDIVGCAICLEYLNIDKICCSNIELGSGFIECAHGILNVPTPAVCEILKDAVISIGRADFEMTTPTGAAIMIANLSMFEPPKDFIIKKIGYGAGTKDANFPNLLKVMLCETVKNEEICEQTILETNIDDMDAESLSYVCKKLLDNGALDVFNNAIFMKKGRIGFKLTILCEDNMIETLKNIVFNDTTSFGVREYIVKKTALKREFIEVITKFGKINMKIAFLNDKILKFKPEFEECKKASEEYSVSISEVKNEVLNEFRKIREIKKRNL